MSATLAFDAYDRRLVLLLLHAFPLDRRMWRAQGEALRERARVLAVDLPGFGASAGVVAAPSLDDWADLVEHLVAGVVGPRPVVVCGLSMGGYVALRLAERHPHRLHALVLADTSAGADDDAGRATREQRINLVAEHGVAPLVESLLPRLLSPTADPAVVARARGIMSEQGRDAVVAALTAMRDRPDSTPLLPHIQVPALVVVGAADVVTPPGAAEAMAAVLPDARLRVIAGAGHLANLEAPDEFSRVLGELLEELA